MYKKGISQTSCWKTSGKIFALEPVFVCLRIALQHSDQTQSPIIYYVFFIVLKCLGV